MEEGRGRRICLAGSWLLLAVTGMSLFQVDDPLRIGWLLLIGLWGWLAWMPERDFQEVGGSYGLPLTLLVAADWIGCLYTDCPARGMKMAVISLSALTVYFVGRRVLREEACRKVVGYGMAVMAGVAILLALGSFWIFRRSVLEVGFEDTYHFRFLFRPLGYIINVWAEVLLLFLGGACLLKRWAMPFLFVSVLAILLTFSRGAYLALAAFLILYPLFQSMRKGNRRWIKWMACALVAIGLVSWAFPRESLTTVEMHRTASQNRSTEGRISAMEASWEAFKQKPLLGYGTGSFTFAIDSYLNQDNGKQYTSFAPNLLTEVCVEKGALGILLYLVAFVLFLRRLWCRRHEEGQASGVLIPLLAAFGVKEMAQATWSSTPFVWTGLCLLLAWMEQPVRKEYLSKSGTYKRVLPIIAFAGYLLFLLVTQIRPGNPADWINRGIAYQQAGDSLSLAKAETDLLKAQHRQPDDLQIRYLLARNCLLQGRTECAQSRIDELAKKYPRNVLYQLCEAEALYRLGEKEQAAEAWIRAIVIAPRLWQNERFQRLQREEPTLYGRMYERLTTSGADLFGHGIADGSRRAYFYAHTADPCLQEEARDLARLAVDRLPNLATPWLLLGDTAKYRLLLFGAFQRDLQGIELPEEEVVNEETLLRQFYGGKFESWYGESLFTD